MENNKSGCNETNLSSHLEATFTKDFLFLSILPFLLKGKFYGGIPSYILHVHDEHLQGNVKHFIVHIFL